LETDPFHRRLNSVGQGAARRFVALSDLALAIKPLQPDGEVASRTAEDWVVDV
jgi:hypothetical protein